MPPAVQPRRQGRQVGWCHAPRPARHQEFLVDTKGVWPENGQFGSPAAPLRMVWKKICHCVVSCSFPVPRHVRGGMVDSFSDRSLMLISLLLPNKVEMLSLCTCHISIAAAIFLTFFPHTMMCRALSILIIKLSQVECQFSIRQVHV